MVTQEEYEYGQRALSHSRGKILCLINEWDFEKNGEPTPQKFAKLIPMGIQTVYRHYGDFKKQINGIHLKEQKRLEEIQIMRDRLDKLFEEGRKNKMNNK